MQETPRQPIREIMYENIYVPYISGVNLGRFAPASFNLPFGLDVSTISETFHAFVYASI